MNSLSTTKNIFLKFLILILLFFSMGYYGNYGVLYTLRQDLGGIISTFGAMALFAFIFSIVLVCNSGKS